MKTGFLVAALAACAASASAHAQTTIYSTDFETPGTAVPGVSGIVSTGGGSVTNAGTGAGGLTGNYFRNDTAGLSTFSLSGLGGYTDLNLAFTLAFIDSWDSSNGTVAPDYLDVFINGSQVLQLTAANTTGTFTTLGGGTQTAFGNFLVSGFDDRIVDMTGAPALQNLAAPGGTLTLGIRFSGAGFQGGTDESWGIDNLRLTGTPVTSAVPEPATWAMMIVGFGFVGASMRRRRTTARVRFA